MLYNEKLVEDNPKYTKFLGSIEEDVWGWRFG